MIINRKFEILSNFDGFVYLKEKVSFEVSYGKLRQIDR